MEVVWPPPPPLPAEELVSRPEIIAFAVVVPGDEEDDDADDPDDEAPPNANDEEGFRQLFFNNGGFEVVGIEDCGCWLLLFLRAMILGGFRREMPVVLTPWLFVSLILTSEIRKEPPRFWV